MEERLGVSDPIVVHGDGFTIPAGHRAAATLLKGTDGVTALLAGNDMMALGAYRAMEEGGVACPGDLSVVGHNDMPFMDQVDPPLTTVSVPQIEVGAAAARMLLALREGATPPERRLLPTKLVIRGSTGPPPR
jgi:LacI family transcriptional regulator